MSEKCTAHVIRGPFLESPERPIRKTSTHSVKLVFPYVLKGMKIEITAKLCAPDTFVFNFKRLVFTSDGVGVGAVVGVIRELMT